MNTRTALKKEPRTSDIVDSVRRLYETKKNINRAMAEAKEIERKETLNISNWMFSNLPEGTETFVVDLCQFVVDNNSSDKVRCTKVRTKKVQWDVSKLKEKLSKALFKKVVDKTYIIDDMEGLVKYLKGCGVDPKKFKKYVHSESIVNDKKLDTMFQTGDLSLKQIDGCYTVKLGEPYIRFTKVDEKI